MKLTREQLDNIWDLYVEFCKYVAGTQIVEGEKVSDFLGWLERQLGNEDL